ncbi:MAG: hypothetical protein GTO14_01210 [Anaerolineales bacterium]|nr:hypothetical protein [Anaerolineales bacterium]
MIKSLFIITLVSELLLGGSLVLTLLIPKFRAWPPPGRGSWQYLWTWGLTTISFFGVLVLGFLDWNTFVLHHWMRIPLGCLLMFSGLGLIFWGVKTLGVHETQGLVGELATDGPYRFTRNPQYLGDILLIAGYAVLCNSLLVYITGVMGILWFILAPFTEEPWLRRKYGQAYEIYASRVPRFLTFRRAKDTE